MRSNEVVELSNFQQQALHGSLLGDGHLQRNKNSNAYLQITRSIKDIEYLRYERSIFHNFLPPAFKDDVKIINQCSKKSDKIYQQCYFRTRNSPIFTQYHSLWYFNKTKSIPQNLTLSPITMAHWIADDGCFQFPKLPYRFTLELSTCSFTKTEIQFLISLLSNRYQETFHLKFSKYYTILAQDNASRAVIKDIDPFFRLYRKRFWDDSKTRFYSDSPPRQLEKSKILFQKHRVMEEILSSKKEISLKELFLALGYQGKVSAKKMKYFLNYYQNSLIRIPQSNIFTILPQGNIEHG